jgi:hypothetical protein
MSNVIDIRDPRAAVGAASMVQTALAALGRVEQRVSLTRELRHHLRTIRLSDAICAEIDAQMKETGAGDYTVGQDAAYAAAERAEENARAAIIALFSGLTAAERRQLGGIL